MDMENLVGMELSDDDLSQVTGGKSIYVTAKTEANIRSGPGKDYPVVGKTIKGFEAKYLGEYRKDAEGRIWCKVAYNHKTGWVSSKYITRS